MTIKQIIIGTILGAFICALLGSCRTRQYVVSNRTVRDTVWTVKTVRDSSNARVVERETTRIVPHIIHVGDTTIIYSDTTIIRNTEGSTYIYHNGTNDHGALHTDTAMVIRTVPYNDTTHRNQAADNQAKWRMYWLGIATALLLCLLLANRKRISAFIKQKILHS